MEQQLADYFDQLSALHDSLAASIVGLSSEALDWSPGPDMNSLAVLIVHTAKAERYWIGDVVGQTPSDRVRALEFETEQMTADRLQEALDEALAHSRGVLEALTVAHLQQQQPLPMPDGRQQTVSWALAHALAHTAIHTGHAEITRQLWDQQHGL